MTLTVNTAAQRLGIAPATIRRWAHEGTIPYTRHGHGTRAPMRFATEDIDRFGREGGYLAPDTTSPEVSTPAGEVAPRTTRPKRTPRKGREGEPSRTSTTA